MASHRVHVHVHIGNKTGTSSRPGSRTSTRRRKGRRRKRYNTTTGSKPGSGKNFASLSRSLAKRGAKNPGALAAYIGRQKYGNARFARMSRGRRR